MQNASPAAPPAVLLGLGATLLVLHLLLLLAWQPTREIAPPLSRPLQLHTLAPAAMPPAAPPPPRAARPPRPQPATPAPVTARADDPTTLSIPEPTLPATEQSAATEEAPQPPAPAETQAEVPEAPQAAPAEPVLAAVPGSVRLLYNVLGKVRGFDYHARAELLWRHDGQDYEARLEVSAFLLGSRVQTSRGRITPEGLAPKRFGDKVRSEVAAHFERDKGMVIFSANTPQAPLQPGAQDHLSVFVQLASLLGGAPERYPPGSILEMQAVGPRDAVQWRFTVDGPQTLSLPGGTLATLKLTRPPVHPYDLTAELWLAPALGWLPARIRLTQHNGDSVDQEWRASEAPQP